MILVKDHYKRECQFSTCHEPSAWVGIHEFTTAPDKNFCQQHADAIIKLMPETVGYWNGINVGNIRRVSRSTRKGKR